ncbi:hypothetical protein CF087_21105 [Clostridium botulinum]|uniref:hypothetical protein n=1 Tax=Clostridium botulinum TaxID=1491 RepID=UPI00077432C0|nr:hypothetical protein [Clostridium botulinum]MBN3376337.1 hypothetical protein [Clostridium botulinum]
MKNIQQIDKAEIKFIYIYADDITDEIEQLLNKGLIKYFYGEDDCEPQFIFLVENEKIIKNTLTSEYRISNIMEEISNILECTEMTAQNAYGDEISLCYETIEELINNDLYKYISTTKQKKIFNAKTPSKALEKILNELGRKQLKIQIEELLIDVDNTEFI